MNQFIQFIQYFGIVLLLFEMAFILYQPASFNQSMMLIFTAAALINTIGYLQSSISENSWNYFICNSYWHRYVCYDLRISNALLYFY